MDCQSFHIKRMFSQEYICNWNILVQNTLFLIVIRPFNYLNMIFCNFEYLSLH